MALPYDLLSPALDRWAPLRGDPNNLARDSDNGDLEDIDWNNPQGPNGMFERLGMPKPSSFPSASEVKKESHEHAKKILADWAVLKKILERHEATIQKRWLKRTREKRQVVLLSAWPNMSREHRPDFKAFIRESPQQRANGTKFKEEFLWPFINLEDLGTPKTFLLFLNARGRHEPHCFANADFEASHFGRACAALSPAFLNNHVMMFTGRTTPETYGELIAWEENENAFEWLTTLKGLHPGQGLQILEAQRRVYEFLLDCCLQILHDIPPSNLLDPENPIQPEPPSVTENDPDRHFLAAITAEAPYHLPASLDFSRLEAIIGAKRSAAEDHILALREDPGYFADVVGDYKEHRQEVLLDMNGQKHPTLRLCPQSIFWNRILGNVVGEAYMYLEIWDSLHRQIVRLKDLKAKYSDQISPQDDLPKEYFEAFLKLRYYLEQFTIGPIGSMKVGVPASPPLRSLFVREPQEPGTTKIRVTTRDSKRTESQTRLLWLFDTLWDDKMLQIAGRKILMDEIERFVQSDTRQKELLSGWVSRVISELSLMSECLHQIELYQPWAASFESAFAEHEDDIKGGYAKTVQGWNGFLKNIERTKLADLGAPEGGRFNYPVDKRRTRENIDAMRAAEGCLDAFWKSLDLHITVKAGMSEHDAVFKLLSSQTLQRTPEYVEPVKATKKRSPEELEKPLTDLHFELEHRTESTLDRTSLSTAKSKAKTRGTPFPSKSDTEPAPEPMELDHQPTFLVDKRALKVFSVLFFNPSRSSQPGEVAWGDFLHAMVSTGFAPEKLYGSVWQFTPTTLDVERSIQFHEPHSSGKIPFRTARRHGRRLNRAYGFHGGMFFVA